MSFKIEDVDIPIPTNQYGRRYQADIGANSLQHQYRHQGGENLYYDHYPESPEIQEQQSSEEEVADEYSYPINPKKHKVYTPEESSESFDEITNIREQRRREKALEMEREKSSQMQRESSQSPDYQDYEEGQSYSDQSENDIDNTFPESDPDMGDNYRYHPHDSYGQDPNDDQGFYLTDINGDGARNTPNIHDLIQDRIIPDDEINNMEPRDTQRPSHSNDENDEFSEQGSTHGTTPRQTEVRAPPNHVQRRDAPITDTRREQTPEYSQVENHYLAPIPEQPSISVTSRPSSRVSTQLSADNRVPDLPISSHPGKISVDDQQSDNINQLREQNDHSRQAHAESSHILIDGKNQSNIGTLDTAIHMNIPDHSHTYQYLNQHPNCISGQSPNNNANTVNNNNNIIGNINRPNNNIYDANMDKPTNEQNRPYFQPNTVFPNSPYLGQNFSHPDQSFPQNQTPYQNMYQYTQPNIPQYHQQNPFPYPPVQPILYYPLPMPCMNMPPQYQSRECGHTVDQATFRNLFYENMKEFTRKTDDPMDLSEEQPIHMNFEGTHRKRRSSRLNNTENDKFLQCLQQISDQLTELRIKQDRAEPAIRTRYIDDNPIVYREIHKPKRYNSHENDDSYEVVKAANVMRRAKKKGIDVDKYMSEEYEIKKAARILKIAKKKGYNIDTLLSETEKSDQK